MRVGAAGVDDVDIARSRGTFGNNPEPPFVAGFEAAGEIVALGEGVTGPAVGSTVMVAGPDAFATYMVVAAPAAIPVPAGWTAQDALGLMINWPTALAAMHLGRLVAGETVLIHAAAGATGQAAVKLAKHRGDRADGTRRALGDGPGAKCGGSALGREDAWAPAREHQVRPGYVSARLQRTRQLRHLRRRGGGVPRAPSRAWLDLRLRLPDGRQGTQLGDGVHVARWDAAADARAFGRSPGGAPDRKAKMAGASGHLLDRGYAARPERSARIASAHGPTVALAHLLLTGALFALED